MEIWVGSVKGRQSDITAKHQMLVPNFCGTNPLHFDTEILFIAPKRGRG